LLISAAKTLDGSRLLYRMPALPTPVAEALPALASDSVQPAVQKKHVVVMY
jgi:hypothetical protein